MFRPRRLAGCALALAVMTSAMTSTAMAQFGGRGLNLPPSVQNIFMMRQEAVQKELKLNDDQQKAIGDLGAQMQAEAMEVMSGLQDLTAAEREKEMPGIMKMISEKGKEIQVQIDKVLDDTQKGRLKELSIQQRGAAAFEDEEVAKALKLTTEQQKQLEAVRDENGKKQGEIMQEIAGGGDRQTLFPKIMALRNELTEKAMAVLTPDQKTTFEKMKGEKFNFPQQGRRPF